MRIVDGKQRTIHSRDHSSPATVVSKDKMNDALNHLHWIEIYTYAASYADILSIIAGFWSVPWRQGWKSILSDKKGCSQASLPLVNIYGASTEACWFWMIFKKMSSSRSASPQLSWKTGMQPMAPGCPLKRHWRHVSYLASPQQLCKVVTKLQQDDLQY